MLENRIFKRFIKNKTSLFGLVLVCFFGLVALFAPLLAPAQNPNNPYQMPQSSYDIAYPSRLKEAIIHNNLRLLTGNLPSYDRQIHKAIGRNDLLSINHRTAAYMESYFDIIFAMNELTHPGEKRMMEYALANASILPEDFEKNIHKLMNHLYREPSLVDIIIEHMNSALIQCLQKNNMLK